MTTPEERIKELGLTLPPPVSTPAGLHLPFSMINLRGQRALFSGHPRHNGEGAICGPFGRLGEDTTTEEGYAAAREIALCVLANLKSEIGELSRVEGFVRVFGMVNSVPEFTEHHLVVNGFSDTILKVFGPEKGRHARSALGVAALPMGFAMEIEGEILISA